MFDCVVVCVRMFCLRLSACLCVWLCLRWWLCLLRVSICV